MKTIGLVGGVASGKSLVAQLLVEQGAAHLDADRIGHGVLAGDEEVRAALLARWGDSILGPDRKIDRRAVAKHVFGADSVATTERRFLEAVLHPRIGAIAANKLAEFAAAGRPAVVLDAPLLLEAGWGPMCDVIVLVDANRAVRLARALSRGWTELEFDRREASQLSIEAKRAAAQATLENNGDIGLLRAAIRTFWDKFVVGPAGDDSGRL